MRCRHYERRVSRFRNTVGISLQLDILLWGPTVTFLSFKEEQNKNRNKYFWKRFPTFIFSYK